MKTTQVCKINKAKPRPPLRQKKENGYKFPKPKFVLDQAIYAQNYFHNKEKCVRAVAWKA